MIFKKNKKRIICIGLICLVSIFFVCGLVYAQTTPTPTNSTGLNAAIGIGYWLFNGSDFAKAIYLFINIAVYLFGHILIFTIHYLVKISSFDQFINFPYVVVGWTMLRDIVNMFFIVGLLIIAFATVLNMQKFEWTKLLFRLLLMAVLVNFSRTILGLIIDAFQVLMLTFVNAYQNITEQTLFSTLGIDTMGQLNASLLSNSLTAGAAAPTGSISSTAQAIYKGQNVMTDVNMLATGILSLFYIIISLVVIGVFAVILTARIFALWILIIASPFAFFAWVFEESIPSIGGLSKKFWSTLWKYLSIGPILAFFLWLSLSTASAFNIAISKTSMGGTGVDVGMGTAGTWPNLIRFIFSIGILIAALMAAQSSGVVGAGLAGGALGSLREHTLGRAENWARRAGKGAKEYGGEFYKAGLNRIELGGGTMGRLAKTARLATTEEGRKYVSERAKAKIRAGIGGLPGELVDQRAKEIDRYEKLYKQKGADKDPNILNGLINGDEIKGIKPATGDQLLALLKIKGEQGKIKAKDFDDAVLKGAFDHYGKVEYDKVTGQIDTKKTKPETLSNIEALTKGWEDAYLEKNGFRRSITPFIRDPLTNDWIRVEPGEAGHKQKAKEAGDNMGRADTAQMHMATNNRDFMNLLTGDPLEAFKLGAGLGVNSRFKMVGQPGQDIARQKLEDAIKIAINDKNDDAITRRLLKADGIARTGTEEDAIVKNKIAEFALARKNLDDDDLKNLQKAYVTSTGSYIQGTGEMIQQGHTDEDLAKEITRRQNEKRAEIQFTNGLSYKRGVGNPSPLVIAIDNVAVDALRNTKTLPLTQRKEAIIKQLENQLPGDNGFNTISNKDVVAQDLIDNSKYIMEQADLKDEYATTVTNQIKILLNQVVRLKGASPGERSSAISNLGSISYSMEQSVESAGMSSNYFNIDDFNKILDRMKNELQGASAARQKQLMLEFTEDLKAAGLFKGEVPDKFVKEAEKASKSVVEENNIYSESE